MIKLPGEVGAIIHKLTSHGYEAYAVGGCVRDCLLGREPEDWDITTSAKPAQVKALFPRTVDTGIQHGTVTVLLSGKSFEVTTYRIDGEYEDGRHPKSVSFTARLQEDLRRRDFTINAMAYNERDGFVDLFDGLRDLERGVIRCVGDAGERFSEDALRMLRAVRFSAQLGFEIEERTRAAIAGAAPSLCRVSAERVQAELVKLLTSPHPSYLKAAYELGITAVILPEFDAAMETWEDGSSRRGLVGEHILQSMEAIEPQKALRLAMLFHDMGKSCARSKDMREDSPESVPSCGHARAGSQIAYKALRRLKFDNDTTDKVVKLVLWHSEPIPETPAGVRRAAYRLGRELLPLLFAVKRADASAQSGRRRKEALASLERLEALYAEISAQKQCLSLKELAVNGEDLISAGIPAGKEIGDILKRLLELVLEDPERNTKEYLLTQI